MINGIINVYKEKGFTSHDVVAKMRGILKMKKIGHTGTLDPDATGVLPLCIGKGTKVVDLITDKDKTYEAVLKLGITTDTQDITGKILTEQEVSVTEEQIRKAILGYIGDYLQLPPMYSAIKVNGKKLYELARKGIEIERARRNVTIHDIRILDINMEEHEVQISVDCSKGTYIRTLLYDIGETLGCGGTMKSLCRSAVGQFTLDKALKLTEIEAIVNQQRIMDYILPIDQMFIQYPKISIGSEYHKLIYNGNAFERQHISNEILESLEGMVRVYDSSDVFIGIYQFDRVNQEFKPVKMFLCSE